MQNRKERLDFSFFFRYNEKEDDVMKKSILLVITILLIVTGCSFKDLFIRENQKTEYLTGKYKVEMKVKNYGVVQLELDADSAPITVTNFVKLVNEKFYDGLTFHRIKEGFMIQGGDPNADGSGGSKDTIKGEFSANGVGTNNIKHERGVISMARATNYDSASSQFFIMHKTNNSLDNYYAAFGHVTSGIEVIDKIAKIPSDPESFLVERSKQPVIEYIKVID